MKQEPQANLPACPQIRTRLPVALFAGLILILGSLCGHAQTLDAVFFGNSTSESAHALSTGFGPLTPNSVVAASGNAPYPSEPSLSAPSDVVTGAMGQTARRLLPRTPNPDIYGGETSFTMAVDPVKQNYFTVKMWGSDPSSGIWFILNINGLELDVRHGGSGDQAPDLLYATWGGWAPNQFIYRTVALPLHITQGKTSVTMKIRSMGWMSYYNSSGYFNRYQKLMNSPSMGLYRAYTHLGTQVDISGETQGVAPAFTTPRALENEATIVTGSSSTVKTNVNNGLSSKLKASPSSLSPGDLVFLASCYDARENLGETWITYPSGMTATTLVNQVIAGIDGQVTAQSANAAYVSSQGNSSWGGYFGPMGNAIRMLWSQINTGTTMATTVAYGGSYGTVSRTVGWSKALRASIDFGRFNRRTIANQAVTCDNNIYSANQGLELVDPANALNESEALRYPKEACGILPWLGSDQAGGTQQVPVYGTGPHGPNWYMCTSKGTTKDGNGFVGSDYGEMGPVMYSMGIQSGDAQIQARGIVMTRARSQFRFPGWDGSGYLVMQGTEPIGERNNGLPGHYTYLGRTFSDDFLMASQGAAVIGNDLLGAFQQEMNDGQLLPILLSTDNTDPYLPMRYAAVKAMAQTGIKLPAAPGSPDFAWADEENMVFAAKHGEERIYANLFWRQPGWINGFAKVFHLSGSNIRLADVQMDDVRFRPTGQTATMGSGVESFSSDQPPDNPVNAYNGVSYPVAWRSDLSSIPSGNADGGRGTGYTFRYGHWLVGINGHYSANYQMIMPSNFTSGVDLITGTTFSGTVTLAPKTSAVFYLADGYDPSPKPARPNSLTAVPTATSVVLDWNRTAGATSYHVKRSSVSGGPYTTIATVNNSFYIDGTALSGTNYYVVSGVSAGGEGGDSSVEASALLQTSGLLNRAVNGAASASTASGSYPASNAFDSTNSTKWYNGVQGGSGWLQYDFGFGINWAVTRYDLTSAADTAQCDPAAWQFQGSNDGTNWTTLDTQSGQSFASRGLTKQYPLTNSTGYRYYRLNVTSNAGGIGYGIQLAELALNASSPGSLPTPSTPASLVASSGSNNQVLLSWTPSGSATSYNVKRSSTSGSGYTTIATTDQPLYLDASAPPQGTYYYVVTSVNAGGESGSSNEASAFYGLALPSAPTGLVASVGSAVGQVLLTWNASSGVPSYNIKRSGTSGTGYVTIASGVTDLAFTDSGLSNGTSYYYVVSASNAAGESANSAEASIVPQTYLWNGTSNANWNSASNWGGSVPGNGSYLIFSGTTALASTTNNFANLTLGGISFSSGAAAFTLSGSTALLGGDISDFATNTETINFNLTLTGNRTFNVNSGSLLLAGSISDGGHGYGIVETGAGTLILTGSSTYSGGTISSVNGTLQVGNSTSSTASGSVNSLGANNSTVTVNGNLRFQMGPNSSNTFTENFIFNSGAYITTNDGKIILGGTSNSILVNGDTILNALWAGKWLQIGGILAGTEPITIQNPNSGQNSAVDITNNANTYSGTIAVSAKSVGGWSTALAVGGTNALANADIVTDNDSVGFSSIWFDLTSATLGSLSGGNTSTVVLNTDGGVNGAGPSSSNSAVTLTVGYDNASTTFAGTITGSGNLVKTGTGLMILSGSNTYTGSTTINAGTLEIDGINNTSAGAYTVNSNGLINVVGVISGTGTVTVNSGGSLGGAGSIAGAVNVKNGGYLAPGAGGNNGTTSISGTLTLNAGAVVNLDLGGVSTSDQIALAGGYVAPVGGTATLNIIPITGFGSGTYPLISGAPGISAGSFVLGTVPVGYTCALTASGDTLSLVVSGPPPIPLGFIATGTNTAVVLNWSASNTATSYNIYRSLTSGAGYSLVGTTVGTTFANSGLTNGLTYYYVVTALNAKGESSASQEVNATPGPFAWVASPTSLNWSLAANWGGVVPANGALLTFGSTSATALNNDLSYLLVMGIVFNSGASSFTLSGNPILLGGNITDNATNVETINFNIILTGTRTFSINNSSGSLVINGVISDGGLGYGIIKSGSGAITLNGNNTYSGGTLFNASGPRIFLTSYNSFGTGPITINAGSSTSDMVNFYASSGGGSWGLPNDLLINAGKFGAYTGDHTFSLDGHLLNVPGGAGTFYVSPGTHAADVNLSNDNSGFNGAFLFYDNGVTPLLLSSTNAGSGSAIWNFTGGNVKGLGANVGGNNSIQLGELTSTGSSGRLFNNSTSGTVTFQLGDSTSNTASFAGNIVDGGLGGLIAVSKVGSSTQILSGSNSYSGVTTINGGALVIAGTNAGSGAFTVNNGGSLDILGGLTSGSASVTVASGGILSGTGAIAGAVTVNSGGAISPGNGNGNAGALNVSGTFNVKSGATLNFDIGAQSDQIILTGSYVAPSGGTATININAAAGLTTGVYNLITGATGISASSFVLGAVTDGYAYTLTASVGVLQLVLSSPTVYWNASPTSALWSAAGNWTGSLANNGSIPTFWTSSITSLTNDLTGFSARGFVFNSGASAFTISGNAMSLDGDLTNNSTSTQTFSTRLTLTRNISVDTNTGGITMSGTISESGGSRSITKIGSGTLTLSGTSTFSGGVVLNSGVLAISGVGTGTVGAPTSGPLGTGTLTLAGGTLQHGGGATIYNNVYAQPLTSTTISEVSTGNYLDLYGNLSGSGTITTVANVNYGGLRLFGDNSGFTGTFIFGNTGAARNKFASANAGSASAKWVLNGTTDSPSAYNFGTGIIQLGELSGSAGNIRNDTAGTATFSIGALNTDSTWAGSFTSNGTIALVKVGTGTLTISSGNGYSGSTTVNAGTLNITGSLTGTGAVTVNSGATLAGTGSIAGATTVTSGAAIAPGNSGPGTLTMKGNVTFNGGSILNVELGTSSDKLALVGGAYMGPSSGTVTVNVQQAAGFGAGSYQIVTGAAGISAASFTIGSAPTGYTVTPSVSGSNLVLTVTAWSAVQSWRFANFGTINNIGSAADDADPNNNGLKNLLEYAYGMNPTAAGTTNPLTTATSSGKLQLSFPRNSAATDLTYTVQGADSLTGTWTDLASSTGGAPFVALVSGVTVSDPAGTGTVTVSVTDLYASGDPSHPSRFLRLKITH